MARLKDKKRAAKATKPKKASKKVDKANPPAHVSPALLAQGEARNQYRVPPQNIADLFKPYRPHARAVPKGVPLLAMDDANVAPEVNLWPDVLSWGAEEGQQFLGFPLLAVLAQRGEYRLVSETLASEATRNWITFKSATGQDKGERIGELEAEVKRLGLKDKMAQVSELDSLYGRAHLFFDLGEVDGPELMKDIGDGRASISKAKIPKGSLRDIRVIEPVWVYPQQYNSFNPLSPDFYRPSTWFVMGQPVHRSRLMTFVARDVPDLLKAAYAFSGLSMTQMLRPYVDNYLDTRQSVVGLLKSFTTFVLSTSMGDVIAGGSGDNFMSRLQFFAQAKNNLGIMAIDKTKEEFSNVSAPVQGLEGLVAQSQEHVASMAQMPLVKFTGISPSGLNASGETEMQCWEDRILSYQEAFYRPRLDPTMHIVMLSLWGEVDEDIIFEFVPLKELSEQELAILRKTKAETGAVLISSKVITPEEERTRAKNDLGGDYGGLELGKVVEFPMTEAEKVAVASTVATTVATLVAENLITPETALEEIQHYTEVTGFGTSISERDVKAATEEPPTPQEGGLPGEPGAEGEPGAGGEGETVSPKGSVSGQPRPHVTVGIRALDWNEADHPRDEDGKFGEGGGGGSPSQAEYKGGDYEEWHDEAGNRKLPRNRSTVIESPLPTSKSNIYSETKPDRNDLIDKAPVRDIPLRDLVSPQRAIEPDRLKQWDPDKADPVHVFKYKGEHVITQGNHRTSAAWVAGAETIKARVIDLDDPKNQKYIKPKFRSK